MRKSFGEGSPGGWLPESKPAEKYEIPFLWGSLHVSEQADKAYGLVPLTTKSLESDTNSLFGDIKDSGLHTDIWLVGPDEMGPPPIQAPEEAFFIGCAVSRPTKKGVELWCSYGGTDDDLARFIREQMEYEGHEIPHDAPPDFIGQEVHHAISHRLADGVVQNLQVPVRHVLKNSADKHAFRQAKKSFLAGFGSAAWIDGFELLANGRIDTIGEVSGIGFAALGSTVAYLGLRKYIAINEGMNSHIDYLASRYIQEIGYDIHRTYCRHHFDSQAEGMFDIPPETE